MADVDASTIGATSTSVDVAVAASAGGEGTDEWTEADAQTAAIRSRITCMASSRWVKEQKM